MPLITKLFPKLERAQLEDDGNVSAQEADNQPEDEYFEFEDGEKDDIDMDGNSVLHRGRPKKLVPELPQKSQLRASRILENITNQLNSLEQAALNNLSKPNVDPHEQYLSSEEEASESADEYDDSIIELDSDRPSSSASTDSCENVARVVSFMFVGKPTMISISLTKPSQKHRPSHRPAPLKLSHSASMFSLPRLTPSRSTLLSSPTSTLATTTTNNTAPSTVASKSKPFSQLASDSNFLSYDPFPAAEVHGICTPAISTTALPSTRDIDQPSTPHPLAKGRSFSTPTAETPPGISWTSSLNRRFSLSKTLRKPSMSNLSKLNLAFSSSTQLLSSSLVTNEEKSIVEPENPVTERESPEGCHEDVSRGISRMEGKGGKSVKFKGVGLGIGFASSSGNERHWKRSGFVGLVGSRGATKGVST